MALQMRALHKESRRLAGPRRAASANALCPAAADALQKMAACRPSPARPQQPGERESDPSPRGHVLKQSTNSGPRGPSRSGRQLRGWRGAGFCARAGSRLTSLRESGQGRCPGREVVLGPGVLKPPAGGKRRARPCRARSLALPRV